MITRLFVSPNLDKRISHFEKILSEQGLSKNHPDLLYFELDEKLGIAEARKIKEHFSLKPYSAKGRAVVLEEAGNLTHEAQNALLKTLEEPPKEAILILGVKNEAELLPTIISRCQVEFLPTLTVRQAGGRQGLEDGQAGIGELEKYFKDIDALIQDSITLRFQYVEKLEKKEEFLKAMVLYFREKLHKDTKYLDFTKKLLEGELWAKQNVNIRGILEYLMLELKIP